MEKTVRIKRTTMIIFSLLLLTANLLVMTLSPAISRTASVDSVLSDEGADSVTDAEDALPDASVSSEEPTPVEETFAEEKPMSKDEKVAADQLVNQMILYRGSYGSEADQKVDELLNEISCINAGYGRLWKNIMDYWDYTNTDFVVNEDKVPEHLPEGDNLCIIVLGYKLTPTGKIGTELYGRLQKAFECASEYPNAWVMCTGGGTASENKHATEGGHMCKRLAYMGIDSNRLIMEDKSKTTVENALNCYDILVRDYPQVDSVLLVSSRYHLKWAALLFEASFMKCSMEKNGPTIHVISNYAYPMDSSIYKSEYDLRWQTSGMFELIGDKVSMNTFFYDGLYRNHMNYNKPEL